ncbi:MAG TPA: hypothetical protein VHU40_16195 [Polyangia bacterium]|nr:hypothetical protein [Polyangia bacterium]
MSMKGYGLAAVAAACLLGAAAPARAGVGGKIARDLAAGAAEGAIEKLEPALGRTLADVDSRLSAHEERIGNVVGGLVGKTSTEIGARLGQVDGILEKRLLQVQLGVDEVLDHGLDKIDGVARARLAQVDDVLAARIQQVDGTVQKTLAQADDLLKNRIADVGKVVTGAIDRADGALGERIEQLDEVAGKRLGNVDVIATKQRLGLERTLTRAAWMLALIIFVIVVLKALWSEYLKGEAAIAAEPAGSQRAWKYVTVLGKPLGRHALVGAAVAALLAIAPERLPMAAVKDQNALTLRHMNELERSLHALDWTRVRFHASQLEFLEPINAARYQSLAAKAELLRDVLSRPTALATPAGVASILEKASAVERMLGGHLDPDAETVRALVLWQAGKTRKQEHEAAARAARALWSTPRGFTMAPMGRLLVEAYLNAPLPGDQEADNLESTPGLVALLDRTPIETAGSPFEGAAALFHLMQTVDSTSAEAFVQMVRAQIAVTNATPSTLEAARARRNQQAQIIVQAWQDFDEALRATPEIAGNALVLGAFRLNDAILTHALWYTTDEKTTTWPRKLADLNAASDKVRKLAIAPARAVWARRYAALLEGPARELIELQEASRFETMEAEALEFERAMAALEGPATPVAPVAMKTKGKRGAPAATPVSPALRQVEAANAAAALGLYQGKAGARTPLAVSLTGDLKALETQALAAVNDVGGAADKKVAKEGGAATSAARDAVREAVRSLRERILGRGPRLI